ncbi:MAG: hypothetical protein LBB11_04455 [Puniceicoccales bacterium]|nr:hypothetical protein [Puniceicoccales bacterium]
MLWFGLLMGCRQNSDPEPPDTNPETCLTQARTYISENRPKEAIKILEMGMRIYNNHSEISELLASAYLLAQDDELAAFYFEQAASLSELKYYCYFKAAEIYERLKDYDQMRLCYEWYLGVLPEDSEVQVKYANALIGNHQKKKALPILMAHGRNDIAAQIQIAELFFEFGNYIQARNWYLLTLDWEKNHHNALKGLWKVGLLLKDWEMLYKAGTGLLELGIKFMDSIPLETLMQNIELRQKAWKALSTLEINFGRIVLPMFFSEEAAQVQRQGGQADGWPPIADAKNQNTPPAKKLLTKGEKIKEFQIQVQQAKDNSDFDGAITVLWRILGLDGKNIEAWIDLTDCLLRTNRYDIAEMTIQEVIKFCPERVDFHLTYLDIVLRTHNSTDYVRILRTTKQKFPKNADVCLLWAYAKEIYIGDSLGAKHSYEKFLKLAPSGHPEISKVERLLKAYPEEQR